MSDPNVYVIERTFDAPRELVWRTWTEPELFARWYGPNVETHIHRYELRSGGLCWCEMRMGKMSMFERMEFTAIEAPGRLEWLHSVADAEWNITTSPRMPNWPRVLHTVVTLTEAPGPRTTVRLTWTPHDATDAERAGFAAAIGGADKGWAMGMDLLAGLLKELSS